MFGHLRSRRGVSTLEYIVILVAFAIGVPLIVAGLTTFIEDRTCEAGALVGSDCVVARLVVEDQTEVTWRGVPVGLDLSVGAQTVIERVFVDHGHGAAQAQSLDRDYIAPRDALAPEDRPLLTGFRVVETGGPSVVSRHSPRRDLSAAALGPGTVALEGTQAVFDPQNAFDVLRSGEHALVVFPFTLEDARGNRGSAQARITVRGFHADDDAFSDVTFRGVPVVLDVLANDHEPHLRHEVRIASLTQPQRGAASIEGGAIRYVPGPEHDPLRSGDTDTVSFTYLLEGPMGVTDRADVVVVINGFSAEPDIATTRFDEAVLVDVLANDHLGRRDELTLLSVSQPAAGGGVSIVSGQVRFDPAGAFSGMAPGSHREARFSYTVRHVSGAIATAEVSVRVEAEPVTYSWVVGAWGGCSASPGWMAVGAWSECSAACGGGTRSRQLFCANATGVSARSVQCVSSLGQVVADHLCGGAAVRPSATQVCTASCSGSSVETQVCNTNSCALPNDFRFIDVDNAMWNVWIESNVVRIQGLGESVNVRVSGPGTPQFRTSGGVWRTSGTISNNQTLQLRVVSANGARLRRTVTVTVGEMTRTWNVTTHPFNGEARFCVPGTYDFGVPAGFSTLRARVYGAGGGGATQSWPRFSVTNQAIVHQGLPGGNSTFGNLLSAGGGGGTAFGNCNAWCVSNFVGGAGGTGSGAQATTRAGAPGGDAMGVSKPGSWCNGCGGANGAFFLNQGGGNHAEGSPTRPANAIGGGGAGLAGGGGGGFAMRTFTPAVLTPNTTIRVVVGAGGAPGALAGAPGITGHRGADGCVLIDWQ